MKNFYVHRDKLKDEKFLAIKLYTLQEAKDEVGETDFYFEYADSDRDYYGTIEQFEGGAVAFIPRIKIDEDNEEYVKFDAIQY